MTVTDLNLRDRIRSTSLERSETDPGKLAELVLADLSVAERVAALGETLPHYVAMIARQSWPEPKEPAGAVGRPLGQRVKQAYYSELQKIWSTEDGHKRFGEFTAADLAFGIALRCQQMKDLGEQVEQFKRAKEMVAKHKKATVADLPVKALAYVYGGAE